MNRKCRHLSRICHYAALIGGLVVGLTARAESQNKVVALEEHWELQLAQPDADRSAPQTTMVISPTNNLNGLHFLFTLNHEAVPEYQPGGMQVEAWDGEQLLDHQSGSDTASLAHSEEVVTWVQRLTLADGHLTFSIRDGHSETWDTFGGDELSVSHETTLTSLNGYRPSVSQSESQVGYAENRVSSLVLTKLVWVTADGQVHEQNAPIPVDISLDGETESP